MERCEDHPELRSGARVYLGLNSAQSCELLGLTSEMPAV